jgi:fatty-acyl-CoA synthase
MLTAIARVRRPRGAHLQSRAFAPFPCSTEAFVRGQMMDYPLTLQAVLQRARRVFPEKEIVSRLEDGSLHRTDYGHFYRRVLRLMDVLRGLGVQPGDRVATFAWNGHRHLELYFAIPCLGAVLHTLNVRLSREQLRAIVLHAGDRLVFVDRVLAKTFAAVLPDLPRELGVVVMDDARKGAEQGIERALDHETLLAAAREEERFPELDETQAAGLCYTSGTTGEPKGVLYSHRSHYLHAMGSGMVDSMGVSQRETVMPVVPMFHANAWGFPFSAAFTGAKLVFPGCQLTGEALADLIERERVTLAAGVPTIWNLVLRALRQTPRDVSSLKSMIVGGSAAPVSLIRAWKEEHGVTVTHAWGMTETSPVGCCSRLKTATLARSDEEQLAARGKQGVPVPGVEVRVEGEDGRELPWDGESVGELCVRGPWVAGSYYKDGSASGAFAGGWFRTGDVVTID